MFKVFVIFLFDYSLLYVYMFGGDFCDCYVVKVMVFLRDVVEMVMSFLVWVYSFLIFCYIIVVFFGLVIFGEYLNEMFGIFFLVEEIFDELIFGFDDKYLNFWIFLIFDGQYVFMGIWVKINNLGGKIYFNVIMLFYKLIV